MSPNNSAVATNMLPQRFLFEVYAHHTKANMRMDFWTKFQRDYHSVRNGIPGRRFRDFRTSKAMEPDSLAHRILMISIALMLVVIGLAIGWLPGPGGFLSIIGLAILAPYIPGIPYCLDKSEIFIRRFWRCLCERLNSSRL
jgi:hypothetical protein